MPAFRLLDAFLSLAQFETPFFSVLLAYAMQTLCLEIGVNTKCSIETEMSSSKSAKISKMSILWHSKCCSRDCTKRE